MHYTVKVTGTGASFYQPAPEEMPAPPAKKASGAAGLLFGVLGVLGLLAFANVMEKRGRRYTARAARIDAIHEATR